MADFEKGKQYVEKNHQETIWTCDYVSPQGSANLLAESGKEYWVNKSWTRSFEEYVPPLKGKLFWVIYARTEDLRSPHCACSTDANAYHNEVTRMMNDPYIKIITAGESDWEE